MYTSTIEKPNQESFFNFTTSLMSLLLILLYLYVLLQIRANPNSIANLYLLMMVQLTPLLISAARQQYNYLSFVLVNHFVSYSLYKYNSIYSFSAFEAFTPSMALSTQCLMESSILICLAYFPIRSMLFYNTRGKINYISLSLSMTQMVTIATYVVLVPVLIADVPATILAIHFCIVSGDMVLLLSANVPGRERTVLLLRTLVLFSAIWYFISTGYLSMLGNLAGYLLVTGCLTRSLKTLIAPLILAVVASGIQVVKNDYRIMLTENPGSSGSERIQYLTSLLESQFITKQSSEQSPAADTAYSESEFSENTGLSTEESNQEALARGFLRAGDDSLERVLTMTPSTVPYWNGESYEALPYIFIPRFLWNEKPSREIWHKFGVTYGYLSNDDEQTSVSVGYLAEGYMNFGYAGLYGVAIFMGILIACVEKVAYLYLGDFYLFSFTAFLMPLLPFGSDLTSMITSTALTTILLFIFRAPFKRAARRDDYVTA